MDYQDIIYTKEEGIATITLNRPDRRNAFGPEMRESMHRALEDAAKDNEVKVLVLTGTGQAFSAGADVKAMAQRSSQPRGEQGEKNMPYALLHRFEKPAAGGGFDLACACDIRIASDRARFAEVFVRRGLVPAMGGTFFLPRLVGIDRACQLIWTGDMIDAKEAERIGLVTMVVPHEELEIATKELAEKLVKGPPLAIQRAKRAIYEGLMMDLKSTIDYVTLLNDELRGTKDHREGATAFLEKREPVFKGE